MSWARIDDSFDGHPKVRKLSLAARGLFASALAHSARFLSDGFLDDEWMRVTGKARERNRALSELSSAGMLYRVDGGWCIHDYLDFNPSRKEVVAERERNRNKQSRRRRKERQESLSWPNNAPRTPGTTPRGSTGRGGGSTTTPTANGTESRASHDPAVVDRMLDILRACPRFTVDEVTTRVGLENMLSAHPGADPLRSTHRAAAWATDPAFQTTSAVRAVEIAMLSDLREQARAEPEGSGKPSTQNAAAYHGKRKCPDCGSPDGDPQSAGRCAKCLPAFEARTLGAAG